MPFVDFSLKAIWKDYPSTVVSKFERYGCRASDSQFTNHQNKERTKDIESERDPGPLPLSSKDNSDLHRRHKKCYSQLIHTLKR